MDLKELGSLVLSWLVVSVLFSLYYLFNDPSFFPTYLVLAAATAGAGFMLHELSHRGFATRYGCKAGYQVWVWGLILSLVVGLATQGQFIFAALGAVYISPLAISTTVSQQTFKRVYGIISLAGPALNLALAGFFFLLAFLFPNNEILYILGVIGLRINLWLAAFNLIPVPPLDGSKVFAWSWPIWLLFAAPAWALTIFFYF
jgi:Zn-dependent protease